MDRRAGCAHPDKITPGRLSQFILYAVFAAGAMGSLSEIGGEIAQASGAAERLFEILAIPPAIVRPKIPLALPQPPRGEVAFNDVRFFYPTRRNAPALNGVSFAVRQGEKLAIVGPSGAGKSTIFHLLLRFYDPTAGSIALDGVRLTDLDPAAVALPHRAGAAGQRHVRNLRARQYPFRQA